MAEDYPSESQGLFSSVLGLVSREIQDFVVTAVTGSSATLSHSVGQLSNRLFSTVNKLIDNISVLSKSWPIKAQAIEERELWA